MTQRQYGEIYHQSCGFQWCRFRLLEESNKKLFVESRMCYLKDHTNKVHHPGNAHDVWLKLCNIYKGSFEIKSSRKDTYNRLLVDARALPRTTKIMATYLISGNFVLFQLQFSSNVPWIQPCITISLTEHEKKDITYSHKCNIKIPQT
jgi:hypothetical protein